MNWSNWTLLWMLYLQHGQIQPSKERNKKNFIAIDQIMVMVNFDSCKNSMVEFNQVEKGKKTFYSPVYGYG